MTLGSQGTIMTGRGRWRGGRPDDPRGRALRRGRRAAVEGLGLTLMISIMVIAACMAIVVAFAYEVEGTHLQRMEVLDAKGQSATLLSGCPCPIRVVAFNQQGTPLAGVGVTLSGSSGTSAEVTGHLGVATFTVVPIFVNHLRYDMITVHATYQPPSGIGAPPPPETVSTTFEVLQ